jgi:hypothetical protein
MPFLRRPQLLFDRELQRLIDEGDLPGGAISSRDRVRKPLVMIERPKSEGTETKARPLVRSDSICPAMPPVMARPNRFDRAGR